MTKAKITRETGFNCAPEGHTIVNFPMGEIVTGKVADWALSDRAASALFDPVKERKVIAPTETKSPKKRKPKK